MENHDQAYHIWRNSAVKQKILIHIDAHHDIGLIRKGVQLTIANFICKALEEGIVKEVFWVVPDKSWETRKTRKPVLSHLKSLARRYGGGPVPVSIMPERMSTFLWGRKLTVLTLGQLPDLNEPVLLDIDIDYLVIPRVSYRKTDEHSTLPWRWPDELLCGLDSRRIRTDLVTIAYSVEGGYTPLKWKYLGDELAARFNGEEPNTLCGMERMREGARLAEQKEFNRAEEKYQEAQKLLPESAAPAYHLALLCCEKGQIAQGQAWYQEALTKDSTYDTPYHNAAFPHLGDKRSEKAEQEFRQVLAFNPTDAYAHFGLARIRFQKRKWEEARALVRKTLELDEHLPDAHHIFGDLLVKEGRPREAIEAYGRALKLLFSGHKSVETLIVTCTEDNLLTDPGHYQIHAKLAHLYAQKGLVREAISGYEMSIAGGNYSILIYGHLALLYMKERKFRRALEAFWGALKSLPFDLTDGVINLMGGVLAPLKQGCQRGR